MREFHPKPWQAGAVVAALVLLLFGTMVAGVLWQNERSARGVRELARDLASKNRDAQIEGCERGNVLRRAVNQRGDVLLELAAALARTELAALAIDPKIAAANAAAAGRYRALGEQIESIPLVDCVRAIAPLR